MRNNKRFTRILTVILTLLAMMLTVTLVACDLNIPSFGQTPEPVVEQTPIPTLEPVVEQTPTPTPTPTSKPTSEVSLESEKYGDSDLRRVGNDEYGFISIPGSWMEFIDIDPMPGIIGWTDGAGAIIQLNLFDAEMGIDPQVALSNLVAIHEGQGAENMAGATVELNGETVYQIHGYYPGDNIVIVTWMFKGLNGHVYYISVEAPLRTIDATVAIVENTFSFEY